MNSATSSDINIDYLDKNGKINVNDNNLDQKNIQNLQIII